MDRKTDREMGNMKVRMGRKIKAQRKMERQEGSVERHMKRAFCEQGRDGRQELVG